jgi:hypothetical protein
MGVMMALGFGSLSITIFSFSLRWDWLAGRLIGWLGGGDYDTQLVRLSGEASKNRPPVMSSFLASRLKLCLILPLASPIFLFFSLKFVPLRDRHIDC